MITISASTNKALEESKKSLERYYELQKLAKDIQKQNKDLIRKTLELTELKAQLEDRNIELQNANRGIQKQNKDLIRKTLELMELKGEIEDRNIELQDANRQILSALAAKTQFINQAAHDLGTPLTPILALLPIIKNSITDKKISYDVTVVENNAKYLSVIVKELITLIKTEAKGAGYHFRKLDFAELAQEIIGNCKIIFDANEIKVASRIQKNLPMIEADGHKLTELLQNLISNAVKFMQKGGKLTFTARKTDNFINVRVSDTGLGMSKKTLSMLFEEFFKADKSRHYQGSGLGLSICKKIVEGHNGRIWAESKGIGKGSTIAFSLPIRRGDL